MCIGEEIFGSKMTEPSDKTDSVDHGVGQMKDQQKEQAEVVFDNLRFDEYMSGRCSTKPIDLTLTSINGHETMRLVN